MTNKIYSLKPMVLIRLLAEMTVLLVLIGLPACTIFVPRFQHLPLAPRLAIYTVSVLALCILPFYGFITWRVKVDDLGLTVIALFKRQFAEWSQLEKLSFKSSWNWRRYIVAFDGGELSFPIWLVNLKELVQLIRDRLPEEGSARGAMRQRVFKQDLFGLSMQSGRVLLGVLFIAIFWYFFFTVSGGKSLSRTDYLLVLAGCIAATVLVGWRCLVIALMPKSLELTDSELIVRTIFFERRLPWSQVKGVGPSFFMLPEGLMLRTAGGSFLLTEELEAVDELEEAIVRKLSATR